MKTLLLGTLLLLGTVNVTHAQIAGQIVGIQGTAYLRATPTATRVKLTPKHDKGRSMSYDDELCCDRGGLIEIRLTGGVPYSITGPSPWTPLPHLSSAVVTGLDQYYRRGGREREERPAILSPAPNGQVQPETFTFKWMQQPGVKTFTLTIFSPTRRLVWQQTGIDATKGILVSESARQAVRQVSPAESKGPFVLVLQDQYNRLQMTQFGLLTDPAAGRKTRQRNDVPHDVAVDAD
jgi:hypothetical protein